VTVARTDEGSPREDEIAPKEDAEAKRVQNVRVDGSNGGFGEEFFVGGRHDVGLVVADGVRRKEDGAREIGDFDAVQIDNDDVQEAEEREVFEDLVAERTCADDEHAGGANLLLVPPWDEPEAAITILFQLYADLYGFGGHGRLASSDLRLQAEDIAILDARVGERLRVLNLAPGVLVVELITERRAVWAVHRQLELLHQHGDDLVAGSIIWKLSGDALVFGGVVDGDVEGSHDCFP